MGSLNPSYKLFCACRRRWVAATPEEQVRQSLILHMTQNLGYPLSSFSLECALNQMPHLQGQDVGMLPRRRSDIVIFAANVHPSFPLYPLLLIECKAVPLNDKAMRQLTGYNHFLQAKFIALANQEHCLFGSEQDGQYQFQDGLPHFDALS